jgi:hypothetical protein
MNATIENIANCCLCNKTLDNNITLIPCACLIKNGNIKSHKICQDCWWNPITGFAREGGNHRCPGCLQNESKMNPK